MPGNEFNLKWLLDDFMLIIKIFTIIIHRRQTCRQTDKELSRQNVRIIIRYLGSMWFDSFKGSANKFSSSLA